MIALVDLSAIYWQAWHSTGADEPADAAADRTVARVRHYASAYPHVGVCCDTGKPTWRHELHRGYKADREAKPESARVQYRRALRTLDADGFALLYADGYEADDVIAGATQWARIEGHDVRIVTRDKDLLQLVTSAPDEGDVSPPTVAVELCADGHGHRAGDRMYAAQVLDAFGVGPALIPDLLALMGDSSDGIPGLPKVGIQTASGLLRQHGSLAGVVAAARDPAISMHEKLRAVVLSHQTELATWLQLALLRPPAALDYSPILAKRQLKPLPAAPQSEPPQTTADLEDETMGLEVEETPTEEPSPETPRSGRPGAPAPRPPPSPRPTVESASEGDAEAVEVVAARGRAIVRAEPGTDAWAMTLEPQTMREAHWLAGALYNSRLFAGWPSPNAILCAVIRGRELGIPALASVQLMHAMSDGKLTMSAALIHGLARKSGRLDLLKATVRTAERCTCVGHRRDDPDPKPTEVTWTMEDARRAGLAGRETRSGRASNWDKYPAQMLYARAMTDLCRLLLPEIVGGLYMPEELEQ